MTNRTLWFSLGFIISMSIAVYIFDPIEWKRTTFNISALAYNLGCVENNGTNCIEATNQYRNKLKELE